MIYKPDLTGSKFGRWTVLGFYSTNARRERLWDCVCSCGNRRSVTTSKLICGDSKSCGCIATDRIIKASIKHGHARRGAKAPEYLVWVCMRQRCENTNAVGYEVYGGRGIKVCDRWQSYEMFISDMGPRPFPKADIDRINNDGDYSPDNCRWTTRQINSRNRRSTKYLEFNDEVLCMSEWAARIGINVSTMIYRLRKWPVERALSEAKHGNN